MSDADRWQRVEDLFDRAADLPTSDRSAFLDAECRTPDGTPDPALRAEVTALLDHDEQARAFFDDANARLGAIAAGIGAEQDAVPDRVGPWRLVREIGRGGMGTVHLAERADGRFEQTAALKLVRAGLAPGVVARFRAERQILARLDHPGIARLLDGGVADDGRPYLVMEFVDGEPVTDYCDRHRLSVDRRLALFRQVCDAVQFAHRQLVVHRDLKPSNILVSRDDDGTPRVKLLDFGIAKLLAPDGAVSLVETATDQRVMTPEYAAPEQVRGEPVTTATDVYALGVLLYELLTGTRPYRVESRARHAIERAILEADPTVPSTAITDADAAAARASIPTRLKRRLAGDLDQIVLRALRKEPGRRYDGAAALSADLGRHLEGLPVEARPESVGYRMSKFMRRNRLAVATVALGLVLIAGWAVTATAQSREVARERDRAQDVSGFLADLFTYAEPSRALGDTLTVRTALDRGVEALLTDSTALAADPARRALLLRTAGDVYANIGLFAPGRRALEAAIEVSEGVDVMENARARIALAAIVSEDGSADSAGVAEALLTPAVDALRGRRGAETELAQALSWRGWLLTINYRVAEALRDVTESVAVARRTGDAVTLGDVLNRAGEVTHGASRTDSLAVDSFKQVAGMYFREALEVRRVALGPVHPDLAVSYSNMAFSLRGRGDTLQADQMTEQVLRLDRKLFGNQHHYVANDLETVAVAQLRKGNIERAKTLQREALAIMVVAYGPSDFQAAMKRSFLGHILMKSGEYDESDRVLQRALRELLSDVGAGSPYVAMTARRLADLETARGRPAAAAEWTRRQDEYRAVHERVIAKRLADEAARTGG